VSFGTADDQYITAVGDPESSGATGMVIQTVLSVVHRNKESLKELPYRVDFIQGSKLGNIFKVKRSVSTNYGCG
jgi:hypothetical protein